jgi:TetR/AcrR family transcriptional regulator, transcriptional repressor for nem operon
MGHSQAEKAESRGRILDAAARQIRQGGLDSLSIVDLMKAANLTHGAFYAHFPSRAALIAAAIDRAISSGETSFAAARKVNAPSTVKSIVNRYLSPAHRDNMGGGCAIAALAADVGRLEDEKVRDLMAARLEENFARMTKVMGEGRPAEEAAVTAWCTMVGAIVLSRVFRREKRADEILKQARQAILDLDARVKHETQSAVRREAT